MAFTPGRTLTVDVDRSPTTGAVSPDAPELSLLNIGPDLVFVAFGVAPLASDVTGFPVAVNVPVVLTKGVGADIVVAWTFKGRATLYVTPGSGA